MSQPPTIHDWWVRNDGDDHPYRAPELRVVLVVGKVYGHYSREDGTRIRTSPVKDCNGRVVTTESGSKYRLGRIHPEYRAWLRDEGIPYNARQPVRIRRES